MERQVRHQLLPQGLCAKQGDGTVGADLTPLRVYKSLSKIKPAEAFTTDAGRNHRLS